MRSNAREPVDPPVPAAAERPLETDAPGLRSIFDSLAEGIVVMGADGRITEGNAAASRILGLTPDQILGRTSVDPRWGTIHVDGSPYPGEDHPVMHALRSGTSSRDVTMGVRRPDGPLTWISINAEPIRGADGQVVGAVASFLDITARAETEARLEAERRLNRRIIETSPLGICIYDEDGNCLAANPAMARDIGATLPQVLAQNFHHIESWRREGVHEVALRALHSDEPMRMTLPGTTSFGKPVVLELNFCGLDLDRGRGLLLVTRDMAEARRAEQALASSEAKYRSLVQQASDGIFVASSDGRFTEANDAACHMSGYSRDELLARRMDDMIEPDQRRVDPIAYDALRAGRPLLRERRLLRKDGTVLPIEINVRMLPGGDIITIARDIGPRHVAEAALRAKEVAERASRAKSEFLSRISHELRTPLNAILGFSEMMLVPGADTLSVTQAGHLRHVRSAGQHLLALIDDLLDLSSIEAGKLRLRTESVDLLDAVRCAVDELRPLAERQGVALRLEADAASGCRVRGDATRVRQVAVNLVSNAIKYDHPGGSVTVRVAPGMPWHRLSVADDGIGMTEAQKRDLFQPFNRLGREHSAVAGSGLGLVVVHHLVEMMGGRISVDSAPGRGSTFVVELAAETGPPAPPPAGPAAIEEAPAGLPHRRDDVRGRVLYVEDDEVNALLMQACLALRPGVELELAPDGRSGLDAAVRQRPDVILIDMSLPDMHGLDVLRRLREHESLRDVPCIAVSADAMPEQAAAGKAAGLLAYLKKPVPAGLLLQTLDRLLAPGA